MDRGTAIDGVVVHPLRAIEDARGAVLHVLRADAPHFTGFGEVYCSEIVPGAVKAWKRHRLQTQRFAVPVGRIKVVVHDPRPDSATRGAVAEFVLGRPDAYALLVIPPLVWYGFASLADGASLVVNVPDRPHDPAEGESLPPDAPQVPYVW